jgi:hypothetical protein
MISYRITLSRFVFICGVNIETRGVAIQGGGEMVGTRN